MNKIEIIYVGTTTILNAQNGPPIDFPFDCELVCKNECQCVCASLSSNGSIYKEVLSLCKCIILLLFLSCGGGGRRRRSRAGAIASGIRDFCVLDCVRVFFCVFLTSVADVRDNRSDGKKEKREKKITENKQTGNSRNTSKR